MSKAAVKIGGRLKERLMVYPGLPSYPIKWASQKQRAWYFAARRRDGLNIQYTRLTDPWSQQLRQGWVVEAKPSIGGAIVGNRVPYGPWAQSDEFQQPMHKATGWKTDRQAVEEVDRSGELIGIILEEIKSHLDQIFRGLG